MNRRETERLVDAIREARAAGEPAAIATVVRVRGSAYRREGARMLVRRNGTWEYALSGGCLEAAVAEVAGRVLETGAPVVVSYDLADGAAWGLGLGCGGAIDIHIEPVGGDPLADDWLTILERGGAAVRVTPLTAVSGRMIVRGTGHHVGGLSDPAVERAALARAGALLAAAGATSGSERIGDADVFYEVSEPPPALIIFGAGHDAAPVTRLAWTLGFAVTVVDVRDALLTTERFGRATLICAHFADFAERVSLPQGSFALVMNHHLERDLESLRFTLESEAGYVGVLGPRARYDRLLAELAQSGYVPAAARADRVRSPVGLAIGAETPDEIATSIVGELLAVCRGVDGGFLNGTGSRRPHTAAGDPANQVTSRSSVGRPEAVPFSRK